MNRINDRRWLFYQVVPLLTALFMSGCAQLTSIYRSQELPGDKGHIVSIDAKQRVVLSNPSKLSKLKDGATVAEVTLLRFCAEPPPDVFTALATSLGVEASFSQTASPEAAAKLASTISENAATIERTQTANILRETMYRNCERYLSGAITEEELIVQAARDQQLIVQVLAVEQITGVARAQSTALTTVAKAAAGGVSENALVILSDAKKDFEAKSAANSKAASEAAALPPTGQCGSSPIDTANLPSGVTAEQAKAKNGKCADAAKAVQLTKDAENYFVLVQQTVAKQGAVSSETQGRLASAAQSASEASVSIAEKVVEIVRQYQAFDEIGMTCVVKLRTQNVPPTYCAKLLEQMAATRAAQLGLEESRLNVDRVKLLRLEMEAQTLSAAELVWEKLGRNITTLNLNSLAKVASVTLSDPDQKRLESANSDFSAFAKAFKRLPKSQQDGLANASRPQPAQSRNPT